VPSGDGGASRELRRGSPSPCLKRKTLLLRAAAAGCSAGLLSGARPLAVAPGT